MISYYEFLDKLKEMNGNNNEGVKVTVYNDKKEEVVSNILNEMAGKFNVHNKKSSYL